MKTEIYVLALENWYDLMAFLSRRQMGQLASRVGNRRFASIIQRFLHKYVRQITLRPIKLTNGNEGPKTKVQLWQNGGFGSEEFSLADWPMPENITNFESIKLSYLDLSVLRFLQIFQTNLLFTEVNLRFITTYRFNCISILAQVLAHLLPLISSINSIVLEGIDLINISNTGDAYYSEFLEKFFFPSTLPTFGLLPARPVNPIGEQAAAGYAQMVAQIINKARILVINPNYCSPPIDWLCNWLHNPREDDQKARALILYRVYDHNAVVERLKMDFLEAKEAVSYFAGIQTVINPSSAAVPTKFLINTQSNERMTIKTAYGPATRFRDNGPTFVLVSRYPLNAAQEWIDEREKEILEWHMHKQSRQIVLDGYYTDIGRMEMEENPLRKFLSFLHKTFLR